jgi:hypothetical protein
MEKKISKNGKYLELIVVVIFIGIGIALRLLPHLPNFTPIAAIALFGGVYLSRKTAFILPLAALIISDIFIGTYDSELMITVYGSFVLCAILGIWLKNHKKWQTVLGSSVAGSLTFFILTNFSVWAFTPWYSKTLAGLAQCYTMALPFFRNTLLGDLFYVGLFFGTYEIIDALIKSRFKIAETAYEKH